VSENVNRKSHKNPGKPSGTQPITCPIVHLDSVFVFYERLETKKNRLITEEKIMMSVSVFLTILEGSFSEKNR
jgi:hypothetical protein